MLKAALGALLFFIVLLTVFMVFYEAQIDRYILDRVLRNTYELKESLMMKEINSMYRQSFLIAHFVAMDISPLAARVASGGLGLDRMNRLIASESKMLKGFGFSYVRFGFQDCRGLARDFEPDNGGEFLLRFPVKHGDSNVGCLSVSFTFKHVRELLSTEGQQYVVLLLRKDVVYGRKGFEQFPLNGNFYVDKSEMSSLRRVLKDISVRIDPGDNISESGHFIFYSVPVVRFIGRPVGYFLFVDKKPEILEGMVRVYTFAGLGMLLVFFMGILVVVVYRGYSNMRAKSRLDYLTRILNRESCLKEARKFDRFSVIFFDIDYFKRVNDTYGHERGDEVLKEISDLISSSIRKSDVFCRFGGEEFLVLLPDTSKSDAIRIAEKLRRKVESHDFHGLKLTISLGVAYGGKYLDKVIEEADRNLYRAKSAGRNRVIAE